MRGDASSKIRAGRREGARDLKGKAPGAPLRGIFRVAVRPAAWDASEGARRPFRKVAWLNRPVLCTIRRDHRKHAQVLSCVIRDRKERIERERTETATD